MSEFQPVPERPLYSPRELQMLLLRDISLRAQRALHPLVQEHTTTIKTGARAGQPLTSRRLTAEGEEEADLAYRKIASVSTPNTIDSSLSEALQETKAKATQCRQRDTGDISREWKAAHKVKKHDLPAFKAELQTKLASDKDYQQLVTGQKLLERIIRERIKTTVTEQDITDLARELTMAGKRVPNKALLRNVIIQKRIKTPPVSVRPAITEQTPPAETADIRAVNLTQRIERRIDKIKAIAADMWHTISERPALYISSAAALATLALSPSAVHFTPLASEIPQPTPITRLLSPDERHHISAVEMPRTKTELTPVISQQSAPPVEIPIVKESPTPIPHKATPIPEKPIISEKKIVEKKPEVDPNIVFAVGKKYPLPKEYTPPLTRLADDPYIKVFGPKINTDEGKGQPEMAAHLSDLFKNAQKEGVDDLVIISCYRGPTIQAILYEQAEKNEGPNQTGTAAPGQSEHQTGLAVDVTTESIKNTIDDATLKFENTPAYHWLLQNAHKYGFVMTYTKAGIDGIKYEPWHWRYVGVDAATYIFNHSYATDPSIDTIGLFAFLNQQPQHIAMALK